MYGLGLFFRCFFCLLVNNIVYKQNIMLLHDLSLIPIFVQSFISVYFLVFLDTLVETEQPQQQSDDNNNF